jgi:O-methyltransferase
MIKKALRKALRAAGYTVHRELRVGEGIPDREFYRPFFSPWAGYGEFGSLWRQAEPLTLMTADRGYLLYAFALQALNLSGEIWECGVYKGGSALLLAEVIQRRAVRPVTLRLFDSFAGMPETDGQLDLHRQGDFSDCRPQEVAARFAGWDFVRLHPGRLPETFQGLEDRRVALAHIDVDIHRSVLDCCRFIYPRLPAGGVMIFDDYGMPSCPGARKAVDGYFQERPEKPIVLPTGQALIVRAPQPEA